MACSRRRSSPSPSAREVDASREATRARDEKKNERLYYWGKNLLLYISSFCVKIDLYHFFGIRLDSVLKEKNSKSKIANIFAKSNYLYLRDNYSYKIALEQLKLKQLPSLGGDLVFLDLTISEKFFKPLNQSINIIAILI